MLPGPPPSPGKIASFYSGTTTNPNNAGAFPVGGTNMPTGLNFSNPSAPTLPSSSTPTAPAPAPSTNPADPNASAGAGVPNWQDLINSDSAYQQGLAQENAAGQSAQALRDSQIASAFEQYGGFGANFTPADLAKELGLSQSDLNSILTPDVLNLAQQANTSGISTQSRLQQANADANRNIINTLTARGILSSGETGFQLNRQALGFQQNEFDAANKLLGAIDQYQQAYVNTKQQIATAIAQLLQQTADRVYQQYPYGFGGNTGANGGAVSNLATQIGSVVNPSAPTPTVYDANGNNVTGLAGVLQPTPLPAPRRTGTAVAL